MTPFRNRPLAATAVVLAFAGALVAAPTTGARGLTTGFDDSLFTASDASTRAKWLDNAVKDRAGIIRIDAVWASLASSRPVAPTNPADPAYDFGLLDSAIKDARARGLDVMLTVYWAPSWAEGKNRPKTTSASRLNPQALGPFTESLAPSYSAAPVQVAAGAPSGTWKPDPKALGQFAQALAKRYSGSFLGLPRVRYFEAWNEPNYNTYLNPQWKGKKPESPDLYRRMLNAFYEGVHKAQAGAKVIGGAVAPYGDPAGGKRMRPITFLQKLFCLNGKLKPKKCRTKPKLDILSDHPINSIYSPHRSASNPKDVSVADFSKVRQVLHAAERAKHVKPGGHHPLWATEIWWITKPPASYGVPAQKAARWLEEGLYLLWKQGASVVVNLEIQDPNYDPQNKFATPTSGVFFNSGKKKPGYQSFRFPFVTHRKSKKKVAAWGKAPESGKLKIQKKAGKGWHTVKKVNVHKGKLFKPSFKLRGHAKLRATVGGDKSLVWRQ